MIKVKVEGVIDGKRYKHEIDSNDENFSLILHKMAHSKRLWRKCEVCGKVFIPYWGNKNCSGDCAKTKQRKQMDDYRKRDGEIFVVYRRITHRLMARDNDRWAFFDDAAPKRKAYLNGTMPKKEYLGWLKQVDEETRRRKHEGIEPVYIPVQ